jgi:hypothetical protein
VTAWSSLPREEADAVWDEFYSRFKFRPSVNRDDWPGIVEPTPSATYSLADGFQRVRDRNELLANGSELNVAMLDAFRSCTAEEEQLYVLDWQHPCFRFQPHREFPSAEWSQWETPVFPDGDYYIFLQQSFEFGTFGHPWEQSLCVFGQRLLEAFNSKSVRWLGPVIRRDGKAV